MAPFVALLKTWNIAELVDVRTVPRSRTFPWFSKERVEKTLLKSTIAYIHLPNLGGFRHPREDSVNTGWTNRRFRAYADYMQTAEFEEGLAALNQHRGKKRRKEKGISTYIFQFEIIWERKGDKYIYFSTQDYMYLSPFYLPFLSADANDFADAHALAARWTSSEISVCWRQDRLRLGEITRAPSLEFLNVRELGKIAS